MKKNDYLTIEDNTDKMLERLRNLKNFLESAKLNLESGKFYGYCIENKAGDKLADITNYGSCLSVNTSRRYRDKIILLMDDFSKQYKTKVHVEVKL